MLVHKSDMQIVLLATLDPPGMACILTAGILHDSRLLANYFDDFLAITENASEFLNSINFKSKNLRYKKVASNSAMIIDWLYYYSLKGEAGGESFLINLVILFEKTVEKSPL